MKRIIILLILLTSAIACKDLEKYEPPKKDIEEKTTKLLRQNYVTRSGITLGKIGTNYIFQGDMILSKDQVAALDDVEMTRGAINIIPTRFWPCTVRYEFEPGFNTSDVFQAIDTLSRYVGIKFVHTEATPYDHIYFVHSNDNVNYGTYGREGHVNVIYLTRYPGYVIAMHEICHTLGMYHEQCRSDRDEYVDILWDNIEPGFAYAFDTYYDRGPDGIFVTPFDFESIMIYSSYNFGIKVDGIKQPTMLKKDGSLIYTATKLSQGDIRTLQTIYGPPYALAKYIFYKKKLDNGWSDVWIDVYVDFYKDKLFIHKTTLDKPRYLNVRISESKQCNPIHTDEVLGISPGIKSYHIGTIWFKEDANGTKHVVDNKIYNISVTNVHKTVYLNYPQIDPLIPIKQVDTLKFQWPGTIYYPNK